MFRSVRIMVALVIVLVAGIPSAALAGEGAANGPSTLAVEVAEDGTRFVFDEAPLLEDGFPAYGNGFVIQGYIYPTGTLDGTNGVNADGSPEFPDQVIGEWTCFGYFVGEGANTTEGAWVVTTQVFDFTGDTLGDHSIVTVGVEAPADAGVALRAVVGGTGRFAYSAGQVAQVTMGHNASDGVDAAFTFQLRGARPIALGVAPAVRPTPQPV